MFETIPKLRDERQAFRGRQMNDFIRSEHFHAFQPTKKSMEEAKPGAKPRKTARAVVGRFTFQPLCARTHFCNVDFATPPYANS
jgi:hypothetical protein